MRYVIEWTIRWCRRTSIVNASSWPCWLRRIHSRSSFSSAILFLNCLTNGAEESFEKSKLFQPEIIVQRNAAPRLGANGSDVSRFVGQCTNTQRSFWGQVPAPVARWYHEREALQTLHTDNMTGTSTRTPTTVARAAGDPAPKSVMATATASSKRLLAPMSAPGDATLCGTLNQRMSR